MFYVSACITSMLMATATQTPQLSESAGGLTLPRTEVRQIRSTTNDVQYLLYVSLPRSFSSTDKTYPTVYLLDADYSFAIARNVVEHLVDRGDLPELVLVGVGYVGSDTRHSYRLHRSRDYTPAFSREGGYGPAYQKQSGGGPRFVKFIADELIPAIEETYRGHGERILVGHSYGGLFAAWTMLSRPELFRRYLVVSPSLWYKDHMMLDFAKLYVKNHTELIADAFFTVGDREVNELWNMPADLKNFYATLTDKPLSVFRSELLIWEGETHNSVFPAALTRGLRFFWPRGTFTPAPAPP